MTRKTDPKQASITRVLARVSDTNRPTPAKYAQVRLVNGIKPPSVYNASGRTGSPTFRGAAST